MKFIVFVSAFFLCHLFAAEAQHKRHVSMGNADKVVKITQGVEITTPSGSCRIVAYSPTSFRISMNLPGLPLEEFTYAVSGKPEQVKLDIQQTEQSLNLVTDSLFLEVSLKPVRIKMKNKAGKILNEDEPAFGTGWIGEEVCTYKKLQPGERFIGLGEKTGGLDRRGEGYTNWNTDFFGYPSNADPLYASIPFYMGIHQQVVYGIFLNNSYKSHFNFGASNDRFSSFTAEDGAMDYFLFGDATVSGILQSYAKITGTMPMPPLWSIGYQQCRYSYYPDKEVISIAKTFREKKIPADVIYLDIHYMDAYKIFTWHPQRFPKPKAMLDELKSIGFHTTIIVDPGIKVEKGYAAYEDGLKKNAYLLYPDGAPYTGQVWPGWCHFPDFTQPAARQWWGESFKGYVQDGVDGFWNDMNEPATWGQRFPDLVEFDFEGQKATHRKGHNLYGFQMARSTYEGTKKLMNGKRPFILTRAGFSGVQRYSAVWTGDNLPTDDHMMTGVRLVNSLGLSGVAYSGYDVGGFAGDANRETFARWITIGAFSPFFRGHTMIDSRDSEPWAYGEKIEEISRNYIQFRYNLMPYLYSTFYEASVSGMPVARSLAVNYTHDPNIYQGDFQHQYLFGPSLMVVPLTSEKRFAKIYLPEGQWYDLHSDQRMEGGKSYVIETNVENLPLYVKAGGMLLMQSPVQSAAEKPQDTLFVHLYTGENHQFRYYEDAGDGYEYEKGEFAIRDFSYNVAERSIRISAKKGNYKSQFKQVRFIIHGAMDLSKGLKSNKSSVPTGKYRSAYMKPISRFDPLGNQGADLSKEYSSFVIPLSDEEILLKW
jgi:alpha-glucosidase